MAISVILGIFTSVFEQTVLAQNLLLYISVSGWEDKRESKFGDRLNKSCGGLSPDERGSSRAV